MRTPAWLQRLEERIAMALARAQAGLLAVAAGSNRAEVLNAAPIGPATFFVFESPPFTTRTGKVRVYLEWNLSANGGTAVVGDAVQLAGSRDGGTPVVLPNHGIALRVFDNAAELTPDAACMVHQFDDSVAPGAHTWGGIATMSGGHTFGALTSLLKIMIQELPG